MDRMLSTSMAQVDFAPSEDAEHAAFPPLVRRIDLASDYPKQLSSLNASTDASSRQSNGHDGQPSTRDGAFGAMPPWRVQTTERDDVSQHDGSLGTRKHSGRV